MRRAILIVVLLIGVAIGLVAAWREDWITRVVMMAVGALFGGSIGAGLSKIGLVSRALPEQGDDDMFPGGLGTTSRDLAANYWRDKGHMPFMKPPRPEQGLHMFDADKNL
jgi:hypothetical protein